MLVIVGASGCGKTTLLRLVAGLEAATAGRMLLDGRDVTRLDPAARDIAMVFQNYALYPHMTRLSRTWPMACASAAWRRPRSARGCRQTADLLGLGALLDRRPRQLSGGQRQRVAMGRAIVREPKLFLFDEPLSNLDATLRVQMRAEIRQLAAPPGRHQPVCDARPGGGDDAGRPPAGAAPGVPVQLAPPMEVFARPANTYVAGFIGAPAMNLLPADRGGRTTARLPGGHVGRAAARVPAGRRSTLGIRPEQSAWRRAGCRCRWTWWSRSAPRRWCMGTWRTARRCW